jgi:hypothetical protein
MSDKESQSAKIFMIEKLQALVGEHPYQTQKILAETPHVAQAAISKRFKSCGKGILGRRMGTA